MSSPDGNQDQVNLAATDPPPDATPVVPELTQVEVSYHGLRLSYREASLFRGHAALVLLFMVIGTAAAAVLATLAPAGDRLVVALFVFVLTALVGLIAVMLDKRPRRH
jgi:hypothetical protein